MSKATKRKHVEKEVQEDFSMPTGKQSIVQLLESRGNNLHEVRDPSGDQYLVSMPTKFRRSIWVKKGDYVLIEPITEGDKVKGEIVRILTKDHIQIYRSQNCWPQEFDLKQKKSETSEHDSKMANKGIIDETKKSDDNEDDDEDNDDDLFVNTNRQSCYHDTTESESDTSTDLSDSD
ncbi:probable RNA-binding protein EIF1AD [Cephus cinctus]|uniref:Probable RNA-binding protein EIF1AD n=1 Tax=Cephus cinctus TaxID=211228 RepID=A0AAJ7BSR9_CEPCN|nr:probable RNA-binding protein EIF1AD [Cephus cinctus]